MAQRLQTRAEPRLMAFWLSTIAMIAAALALVIPPLLRPRRDAGPSRRDINASLYHERLAEVEAQQSSGVLNDEQAAQARDDLNREMLAQLDTTNAEPASVVATGDNNTTIRATALAIVITVALPLVAFAIYVQVGTPAFLFDPPVSASAPGVDNGAPPNVEQMVARLEQRMRDEPDDVRGWLMLGRSYLVLNRPQDARTALANALQRAPDDPEVMVSYAEVLTTLNDGSLVGEPIDLVNRALVMQPQAPRALWLAGIHALNEGIPSQAIELWQKILDGAQLDADVRAQVSEAIVAVRSAATDAQSATAPAAAVEVTVSISESLSAGLRGDETVFVFARATDGPPMPLAVQRLTVSQLPVTVLLDDSLAMAPELSLSRFDRVVVTARVSFAGTPRPATGDLQGVSGEVATRGAAAIELMINERLQ